MRWVGGFCLVTFLMGGFLGHSSQAQEVSEELPARTLPVKNANTGGIQGRVKTDGALIYNRPDFDADVLATLSEGTEVRISRGVVGEFAKFHRVRIGDKIGYIAEIDVTPEIGAEPEITAPAPTPVPRARQKSPEKSAEKILPKPDEPPLEKPLANRAAKNRAKKSDGKAKIAKKSDKKTEKKRKRKEFMYTRYVGLAGSMVWYKEDIRGVASEAALGFFGLKLTGPDVLLQGPIMDFNLLLHYGAPDYYGPLSYTAPTGFILMTDALFLLPFVQEKNHMYYLGVGPLLVLSEFKIVNGARSMDLVALNFGLSTELGVGFRIGSVAFRVEGKYHWERRSYRSVLATLQTAY